MKAMLFLLGLLSLTACQLVMTHSLDEQNTYQRQTSLSRNFYAERSEHQRHQIREDLGYQKNGSLSETQSSKLNRRIRLKTMEAQLHSKSEKQQYYQLKPYFKNDQQRISFLNLPSFDSKQKWIQSKAWLLEKNTKASPEISGLIDTNDIGLNMSRQDVRESWGPPDYVESAGSSIYGNERWVYSKMQSTTEGYIKETRVIYFEAARVAGWDKY